MGMDVYGKNPTAEVGKYVRYSVWSWHPLAELLTAVAPKLLSRVKHLHSNDGDGLGAEDSKKLAALLRARIESGEIQTYISERAAQLAALPDEPCEFCKGTGVRTDEAGVQHGQPERITTRADGTTRKGWCNGCDGKGSKRPFQTYYFLELADVREFADFLEHCGGFRIH